MMKAILKLVPAGITMVIAASAFAATEELKDLCAKGARNGDIAVCEAAHKAFPNDLKVRKNYARAVYITGRYDAALDIYKELAAKQPENAQAQLDYAGALGSLKRYPEAVAPIEAAMRLDPKNLIAFRTAVIIFRNVKQPANSFKASLGGAELGDRLAMYELAWFYFEGEGTEKNETEGVKWMEKAAGAGHVAAMREVAEIYLDGLRGKKPDQEKALKWAKEARKNRFGN